MASTCFCCRRATMAPAVVVLPASSTRRQAFCCLLLLGQAAAATAVFVEMTGDSFRGSPSSCGNRRAAYGVVVASACWLSPRAKHSDETRNAGRTKRLNRIIGAGR